MKKFAFAAAALLSASFALSPSLASAATLTVGNGTIGNCFPFGCGSSGSTRYQQVYNSNQFSGPISISSISFERVSGTTAVDGGIYSLSLSTTAAAVDALSSVFNSNLGGNNVQLFSGALAPIFNGTTLTFNLTSPFTYNPGNGNLLLDFQISGLSGAGSFFKSNSGDAGGIYSRMHNFGIGFSGFGLVTTFNFDPASGVPEPATWALMLLGFAGIGFAMRRKPAAGQRVKFSYS